MDRMPRDPQNFRELVEADLRRAARLIIKIQDEIDPQLPIATPEGDYHVTSRSERPMPPPRPVIPRPQTAEIPHFAAASKHQGQRKPKAPRRALAAAGRVIGTVIQFLDRA